MTMPRPITQKELAALKRSVHLAKLRLIRRMGIVDAVLLDSAVRKSRKVRTANPKRDLKKSCVYVGMTALSPEERFANHKAGIKAAWVIKRYGLRLLPELYAHLNPMPFEAAAFFSARRMAESYKEMMVTQLNMSS